MSYGFMLCEEVLEKDLKNLKPEEWIVEEKLDGQRAMLYYDGTETRIYGRNNNENGSDITDLYPEIRGYGETAFIIDGEIVHFDKDGKSNYPIVMKRAHSSKMKAGFLSKQHPCVFMAFDILDYADECQAWSNIEGRKELLERVIGGTKGNIQVVFQYNLTPEKAFELAQKRGVEGIILKKRATIYDQNRSKNWVKVKCWKEMVVDIISLNESDGHGSLLTKMGDVGLLTMKNREFYLKNKPTKVQVKFLEITPEGKLRQPIFLSFVNEVVKCLL